MASLDVSPYGDSGSAARQGKAADCRLLRWLEFPAPQRGIWFAGPGDAWEFHSYEELAAYARRQAWRLHAAGVRRGAVVAMVHSNSPEFVATFFGCLLLGGTPAPVAPPARFQAGEPYREHLSRILRVAGASVVSTTARLAAVVAQAADGGTVIVIADEPGSQGPEWSADPVVPPIGLLQLSSGTTGPSHGVRVPLPALEVNIATIQAWTDGGPLADAVASWAPLYHDMGLIGCLLAPLSYGADVWLMEPDQFVRTPARWLRCFAENGATLTAAPSFALQHVVNRVSPDMLRGMNFAGWRALVVGAERVDASAINAFTRFLEPFGFNGQAVMPAYGLAEATLTVTGSRRDEDVTEILVDPRSLIPGNVVGVAPLGGDGIRMVGCGKPFPGTSVVIVDDAGNALADQCLGEIELTGPSVAHSYVSEGGSAEHLLNGVVRTGDAGFFFNGELFVVGRIGDSIKVRGRWLFAEDVDGTLGTLGFQARHCVALLGPIDGAEVVAVIGDGFTPDSAEQVGTVVANYVAGVRVIIFNAPRRAILRTTSGKPRRRAMWQRLLTGELDAKPVWDSDSAMAPNQERRCRELLGRTSNYGIAAIDGAA
jgi:acyl-CoA synthetase (AMP-forming)/AMP-acid ligase II